MLHNTNRNFLIFSLVMVFGFGCGKNTEQQVQLNIEQTKKLLTLSAMQTICSYAERYSFVPSIDQGKEREATSDYLFNLALHYFKDERKDKLINSRVEDVERIRQTLVSVQKDSRKAGVSNAEVMSILLKETPKILFKINDFEQSVDDCDSLDSETLIFLDSIGKKDYLNKK